MKRKVKVFVTLLCVCAMILSASSAAMAAEASDVDLGTVYAMAQKALDQQAIQNIMTRHVMYHCYGLHQEEMEELWVQEPENQATASFGQNQGFYVGYQAIWDSYVDGHTENWLSSAKSYCEKNNIDIEGWTDEEILDVYGGVGQLLLHVTTTSLIEVAEDGQTAKCFWYSPGMICETGQSGNTIWEAYGVDFVKEGNDWKIWHLHMFTDFMGSFYLTLGGSSSSGGGQGGGQAPEGDSGEGESPEGESPQGESPEGESADQQAAGNEQQAWQGEGGAQIAKAEANDYLYSTQYSEFSSSRLRSDMELFLPTPYDTWSFEDQNYGPTQEELESYNIDLDAWYAAHSN